MSEESVNGDQLAVDNEESRRDAGGTGEHDVNSAIQADAIAALKASHAEEVQLLREEIEGLRDAVKEVLSSASEESRGPVKTAGVRPGRVGVRSVLEGAALAAKQSGSRGDVQEYLRLRRQCV